MLFLYDSIAPRITASVTRCENKSSPIFLKSFPNNDISNVYFKRDIFQNNCMSHKNIWATLVREYVT